MGLAVAERIGESTWAGRLADGGGTMRPESHQEEGYRLMGPAFEAYSEQGYGRAEEIHQQSLELELHDRGIGHESKRELACIHKGRELKRRSIPALIVPGCLIVELKPVSALAPGREAQLINTLRLTRTPAGDFINFGHKDILEGRRLTLSESIPSRLN